MKKVTIIIIVAVVTIIAIWADPTLANTLLGWRAERPLEETLRTAWQWQLHLGQR